MSVNLETFFSLQPKGGRGEKEEKGQKEARRYGEAARFIMGLSVRAILLELTGCSCISLVMYCKSRYCTM